VVLCVDEKPHIQALDRAQGRVRLPNWKTSYWFNRYYKRHGTGTLFAVLEAATGQVQVGRYSRRRGREFLDFLNDVVAAHPGARLHIILDNVNTHKPKQGRGLARHASVCSHIVAMYSSWPNMVEIWCSILSRQALQSLSCTAVGHLREGIDRFAKVYQRTATPFEWTRAVFEPFAPEHRQPDLCK
jgi:transposase